jgi:hypothetical protein
VFRRGPGAAGAALPHLRLAGHGRPLVASGVYTFRARRGKIGSVCPLARGAFGVWITHLRLPTSARPPPAVVGPRLPLEVIEWMAALTVSST